MRAHTYLNINVKRIIKINKDGALDEAEVQE
jgi:hypothetical protein